jgi:hypothetical protein
MTISSEAPAKEILARATVPPFKGPTATDSTPLNGPACASMPAQVIATLSAGNAARRRSSKPAVAPTNSFLLSLAMRSRARDSSVSTVICDGDGTYTGGGGSSRFVRAQEAAANATTSVNRLIADGDNTTAARDEHSPPRWMVASRRRLADTAAGAAWRGRSVMRGARFGWVLVLMIGLGAGCSNETPPAAPPAPAAPPPAPPPASADAAAKPKMVANPDGLSLADRIAKRQAAEKKLATELADAENKRLLAYDKGKLPQHKEVFAAIKKYRAAYAKAKTKEDVEKVRVGQQKALEATGKKMATIDPKGGNSNVVTDYDIMLNAIANDYPDALELSFAGDKKPLEEQTAELDKRTKKIEDWLAELKAAKK